MVAETDPYLPESPTLLALPSRAYDVLISDIDQGELINIGEQYQPTNLSSAVFPTIPFPVLGRVHGKNQRLMVPLVCQHAGGKKSPSLNVWFIVDTGAPYTYLTVQTIEKLVGQGFTNHTHNIMIQDQRTYVECEISRGHFTDVNVLGIDAIQELEISIIFQWKVSKKMFYLVRL
ncbi:unnamed protein product, partial [Mesorhabditis spiculigera]